MERKCRKLQQQSSSKKWTFLRVGRSLKNKKRELKANSLKRKINQHHCWFSSNCELAKHALCTRCMGVISERKVEEGISSPWRIQIIPISANENDTHKHPEDYIPFLICKTDQWKFGSNVWHVESRQKWLLLEKLTLVPDLTLLWTALGDVSHFRKPTPVRGLYWI